MMKSLVLAAALTLIPPGLHSAEAATPAEWRFRVLLDGNEIGSHRFELQETLDGRVLTSEARFQVRILFFNAYRYDHLATEVWRGSCLDSLTARTDVNGRLETVRAARDGDRIEIDATSGRTEFEGCVRSFAYWNPEILEGGKLLNAQTGELVPIEVSRLGEEVRDVRGESRTAQRFRLSGPEIAIDLWYTDGRDWVGLESSTRDGRRLTYEIL